MIWMEDFGLAIIWIEEKVRGGWVSSPNFWGGKKWKFENYNFILHA